MTEKSPDGLCLPPKNLFALKLLEDKGWKTDWDSKKIIEYPVRK